jgi:hypothetical protein
MTQGGPVQRSRASLTSWVQEGDGGRAAEQDGSMGMFMMRVAARGANADKRMPRNSRVDITISHGVE